MPQPSLMPTGSLTAKARPSDATKTPSSDAAIVQRVLAGETSAYEILMRRYNQRLYRVCMAILRSPLDAQEVVQDVYVKAYYKLSQFEGRAALPTWLTRIALNECTLRQRRKNRWTRLEDQDLDQLGNSIAIAPGLGLTTERKPDEVAISGEHTRLLSEAIDRLQENYRIVFMLRHVEMLSTAETAQCLKLSEDNVKVRLLRARKALRRDLTRHFKHGAESLHQFAGARCDQLVSKVLTELGEGE